MLITGDLLESISAMGQVCCITSAAVPGLQSLLKPFGVYRFPVTGKKTQTLKREQTGSP